jgi:lipoprotein-releasing system permease protein
MNYETALGLRFTRSGRRAANPFISFIALISVLGMALGIMTLIVVLSVMNGFQKELRTRILGVASHLQVTGIQGDLHNWSSVWAQSVRQPGVVAAAPYVQAQAMLSAGDRAQGVMVRGVDPNLENQVADFAKHIDSGRWEDLQPGEFATVLGVDLAYALRVGVGDKVTLIAPQGLVTPAGVLPRLKQFRVVGIFAVGMYEYDSGLALIHLDDAQKLYRMGDAVSGVRLKTADLFAAPSIGYRLREHLDSPVRITDWTQSHANFFRAVAIEKKMMFLILLLIVAVAAFNIVSALVMAVTEKESDIAILRTMGATSGSIMRIFMIQGALIGLIGLCAGVVCGVALALNVDVVVPFIEKAMGIQFLAKDVYYISDLPSELQLADVLIVVVVAFMLTVLATLYPSFRASRVNPAQALRYD